MGFFYFIFAMAVIVPIAKAIAHRIARGTPDAGELKRQLQSAEQRLHAAETRLLALEERVDFYEKLLAGPRTGMQDRLRIESMSGDSRDV